MTENILLYMNVLLRATICDNLSEKKEKKKKYTGVWAQCQLPFNKSAPGPRRPHTACDYLHPFEIIETQVRQINATDCWEASYKGLSALGSVAGGGGGSTWKIRFKKEFLIY